MKINSLIALWILVIAKQSLSMPVEYVLKLDTKFILRVLIRRAGSEPNMAYMRGPPHHGSNNRNVMVHRHESRE